MASYQQDGLPAGYQRLRRTLINPSSLSVKATAATVPQYKPQLLPLYPFQLHCQLHLRLMSRQRTQTGNASITGRL